jgi:hypothetical protein
MRTLWHSFNFSDIEVVEAIAFDLPARASLQEPSRQPSGFCPSL